MPDAVEVRRSQRMICLLYALSGLISLGYQVIWYRVGVDRFGATNLTFALVVVNFIGGLGVGSLAGGNFAPLLARWTRTPHPLRLYGLIELTIAATAALTIASSRMPADLWGRFPYSLQGAIYVQTLTYRIGKIAIMTAIIFIPCFFMGMTFPLLASAFQRDGRFPARLYAWNTLGACIGILICEFFFLQRIGHERAFLSLVAANAALGLFCFVFGARWAVVEDSAPFAADIQIDQRDSPPGDPIHPSATLTLTAIGGFLCGALEGDIFQRIRYSGLQTAASMSFIAFWAILAIFAASVTVRLSRGLSLRWIKLAMFEGFVLYWVFERNIYAVMDWILAHHVTSNDLVLQLLYTGLFVFPAYGLLSLLLPWLCNREQSNRRRIGRVYGVNTAAFCAGMLVFGSLATRVNNFYAFKLFIGVFAVLVALTLALDERRAPRIWKIALALFAVAGLVGGTSRAFDRSFFNPRSPSARYAVRAVKSNGAHTTYVLSEPDGDRLYFDTHTMSGVNLDSQRYMRLMAHLPLLAQTDPKRALLICFGVGNTASAIATHASIDRIDVVDLNDKVFETAPEFVRWNHGVNGDPRLRPIHDDGRNFLNLTEQKYDLITSEPPPPLMPGVFRLYSREYYASVLDRLTSEGMMTQWLPYEQMPQEASDLISRTFIQSFPYSAAYVGAQTNIILIGGRRPLDLSLLEKQIEVAPPAIKNDLASIGISRPLDLLARFVAGPVWLRERYGRGRDISDQRKDLEYTIFGWKDAVFPYDPGAALRELEPDRLVCGPQLRDALGHLGRLRTIVPDFRAEMLLSAPQTNLLKDSDRERINALNDEADKKVYNSHDALAVDAFDKSLARDPDQVWVWADKARAEERLGRTNNALESWRRALALDPGDPVPAAEIVRLQIK